MGLARGRAARAHGDGARHAGPDGVSRAVNEADRGLLPAEATIVVGQPCTVDPSRAPEGKSIIWIQLQELPRSARRATRSARSTSATAPGRRRCARPTRIASSRAWERRSRTSRARRSSASCSHRPTSRASTATSSAATSTPARARSTRTCCGGRPAPARPQDGDRRPLAHRRLDPSRARAWRRLGLPGRQAADEADRSRAGARSSWASSSASCARRPDPGGRRSGRC